METTYQPVKEAGTFSTERQEYPTCPWCGFVHNEPYAGQFTVEGIADCENCGKSFEYILSGFTTTKYEE